MQRTFDANSIHHIVIHNVEGTLQVRAWEQNSIEINADETFNFQDPIDGTLTIQHATKDLILNVPFATIITANNIHDDLIIEDVHSVNAQDVHKNVSIKNIQGEGTSAVNIYNVSGAVQLQDIQGLVTLNEIHGELAVNNVENIRILHKVHKNAAFHSVGRLEAQALRQKVILNAIDVAEIDSVGNGLIAREFGTLNVKHIGNTCELEGLRESQVTLGHIGNSLRAHHISNLTVGHIGNACHVYAVQQNVTVDKIGNELDIQDVVGDVQVGKVGGNARIHDIHGQVNLNKVGGSLDLQANFVPGSSSQFHAGGNIKLALTPDADITVSVTAAGGIRGQGINAQYAPARTALIYGNGSAQLTLIAGGKIEIHGDTAPTNYENVNGQDYQYADLYTDIADMVKEQIKAGKEQLKTEKERLKAEQERLKAEKANRASFRMNKREWNMDQERIDHIVEQAQRAAAEGLQGAFETVEQALKNLGAFSIPPIPPVPPVPPMSNSTTSVATKQPFYTANAESNSQYVEHTTGGPARDIEQERETILRMIAEGRITSEEGDMLLEALGS